MRSRYKVYLNDRAHFVTCTVVEWLPIFTSTACCDIVVESLKFCRQQKGLKVYAWVIMDNHIHAVLSAPDLSAVLRDCKSYTAKNLLKQIEVERRDWLLNQLKFYCGNSKPGVHQVWQEGSHPQLLPTDEIIQQKLDYLHNNPVKRGWVAAPEHWRYSSAHAWLGGGTRLLECDPWC